MSSIKPITLIVAIVLGIIGLIWLIQNLWVNSKVKKINTWPKTNATVISALAEPANSAAGNVALDPRAIVPRTTDQARYTPVVNYIYTAAGRDYRSNNFIYRGSSSFNSIDIVGIMSTIVPGQTISVYYNPSNPSEAYIWPGDTDYTGTWVSIALIIVAVGVYFAGRYYGNKMDGAKEDWNVSETVRQEPWVPPTTRDPYADMPFLRSYA